MKSLFEDEDFQKSKLKKRAYKLLTSLDMTLKKTFPAAPGLAQLACSDNWAESAVKLKQKLMIDADEYRVHSCRPGTKFDPTWMQAEDIYACTVRDDRAEGKTVAACLFPALSRHEVPPAPKCTTLNDLNSLLVANKQFFPSFKEKQAFDPQTVISKAVVLVL